MLGHETRTRRPLHAASKFEQATEGCRASGMLREGVQDGGNASTVQPGTLVGSQGLTQETVHNFAHATRQGRDGSTGSDKGSRLKGGARSGSFRRNQRKHQDTNRLR